MSLVHALPNILHTLLMILLGIGLGVILNLVWHEIGHAVALLRRGLTVLELGVGIPLEEFSQKEKSPEQLQDLAWRRLNLPNYYRYKARIKASCAPVYGQARALLAAVTPEFMKRAGGKLPSFPRGPILRIKAGRIPFVPFDLTLAPLLIGAYVKQDTDELRDATYTDKSVVYGAGVVMNLLLAELIGVAYYGVMQIMHPDDVVTTKFFAVMLIVFSLTFIARRVITMVAPFIGLAFFAWAVFAFSHGSASSSGSAGGGPIFAVKLAASGQTLSQVVFLAAIVSLSLAFTNMIPMVPLDGGFMAVSFMKRVGLDRFIPAYRNITGFVFVSMFGMLMLGDVVMLLRPVVLNVTG